jgi:multidrug efflux system membrane fusion protein
MTGCNHEQPRSVKPLTRVEVASVQESAIPIFLEGIGHVRAFNYAEIKSQVEGELFQVQYEQGKDVEEGELLLTIDPRPYQAKLQEAEGMLLESKANLRFAEEKVGRFAKLVKEDYVSKLDYDEYVTNVEALMATVKKNEGTLADAKVNLDYCYIRAPFSGRVGKKLVDKGNLIANDGATLVTLNQIQPIYVDFSLPEKELTRILKRQHLGELVVKVCIPEVEPLQEEGRLIVIDNRVDPSTGMIPLRAQFTNENKLLWPGQFAKVRLILKEKEKALLVPEEGVNLGQKGYFVMVLDSNNHVEIRSIKLGEKINEIWEVTQGLSKGDRVIINGQINVLPGQEVEVANMTCDDNTFNAPFNCLWSVCL